MNAVTLENLSRKANKFSIFTETRVASTVLRPLFTLDYNVDGRETRSENTSICRIVTQICLRRRVNK